MIIVDKFTGTNRSALGTIQNAVADRIADGFTLLSNTFAYYKRENGENGENVGENVGVSLFVWSK